MLQGLNSQVCPAMLRDSNTCDGMGVHERAGLLPGTLI